MTEFEMVGCLNYVKQIFPRFSASPEATGLWFELVGKHWTEFEFKRAVKSYAAESERVPAIANIRGQLEKIYGRRAQPSESVQMPPAYPQLEILMDILGPETVLREIEAVVPCDPEASCYRLTRLVESDDWVLKYRAKMRDLVHLVRETTGIALEGEPEWGCST